MADNVRDHPIQKNNYTEAVDVNVLLISLAQLLELKFDLIGYFSCVLDQIIEIIMKTRTRVREPSNGIVPERSELVTKLEAKKSPAQRVREKVKNLAMIMRK